MWSDFATRFWGAVAAIVIGYELYCVLDGNVKTPPLTHTVVRYVPWWATLTFLGWLVIHFAIRYINPEYVKKLKVL